MDTDAEFHSLNILKFMGEVGMRFPRGSVFYVLNYVKLMVEDKRVIELETDGKIHAVLFYSLCYDTEKFLKKDTWEFKEHDKEGTVFYIEKMVASHWSIKLHNMVYDFVTDKYKEVEFLKWHKWSKIGDREVVLPVKSKVCP